MDKARSSLDNLNFGLNQRASNHESAAGFSIPLVSKLMREFQIYYLNLLVKL
jgi:hypothetical protein